MGIRELAKSADVSVATVPHTAVGRTEQSEELRSEQ
jgi:hypothetical protein